MKIKKVIASLGGLIILMIVGGSTLFVMPSHYLSSLINITLPTDWKITLPTRPIIGTAGVTVPQFTITVATCPLVSVQRLHFDWHERALSLSHMVIDYACLAKIPISDSDSASDFSLSAVLALLPQGKANIKTLSFIHLPEDFPPRIEQILTNDNTLELTYFQEKLTILLKQQAGEIQVFFEKGKMVGDMLYHPNEQESHQLHFLADLADDFTAIPTDFQGVYHWQMADDMVTESVFQQGEAKLEWQSSTQQIAGRFTLSLNANPDNQLTLPFQWQNGRFSIQQGKIDWLELDAFPLHAYLTADFQPKSLNWTDIFPIQTAFKLSILSQNAKGKGNIVISTQNGELQKNSLNLPLQVNGNIKHQAFILYSAIPLDISGTFNNIRLRFLQGALLRVTGKERFLTVDDLRFPLAGIRVDKYGIHGRLQAIFRGESPDFKQIEMRLDGYARNFKAGALNFFEDTLENNDQWGWRFWGDTTLNQLKSKLSVSGRGNWHKNVVKLNEFQGLLSQIKHNGIYIPQTELKLTESMQFAYEDFHLTGGVLLHSPKIAFGYGGELERPKLNLAFNGELENLNFKGDFTSGQLGPIRLFARRELNTRASQFRGRLYWSEQSAMVFQSLFPFRKHWVITNGTIKGETAFSVTDLQGLTAGGHFSIKNGDISLPDGEIKGLQFSLPYTFKNNEIDIGVKKPLELTASEINLGLKLQNIRMKVAGHYPYTKRKPLFLRELSLNLLGGTLNIDRLALPQTQVAYLNLKGIRFEEILALAQYHQLKLTGSANAEFPFWLAGKPCYICNGKLTQAETSYLKFTPELLKAIQKGGYTEQILMYMVNDSQVNNLNAVIDLDSQGQMILNAKIQSQLAEHKKAKINLNYTHQENVFELWELINYGSHFEQQIEHSIYQQLDQN